MSVSASPTGQMNLVGAFGDDVVTKARASTEVKVGDILIAVGSGGTDSEDYYGEPASGVNRDASVATMQTAVAGAFLGVSKSYRSALETSSDKSSDVLTVAIRGRAKFAFGDAAAHPVGTLVGVAPDTIDTDSKYGALPQAVTVVTTAAKAIGKLAKATTATDTTAIVEFASAIMGSVN